MHPSQLTKATFHIAVLMTFFVDTNNETVKFSSAERRHCNSYRYQSTEHKGHVKLIIKCQSTFP